jgi:hypothetical protein
MAVPNPSQYRVVRIYGPQLSLAPTGSAATEGLRWQFPKHPLDDDWWWIDATGWLSDIADVLGTVNLSNIAFSGGDGSLSVLAVIKSADNLQLGVRLLGGTSTVSYVLTVTLNGSLGFDIKAVDIDLLCFGDLPLGSSTPWIADFSDPNNSAAYYYL